MKCQFFSTVLTARYLGSRRIVRSRRRYRSGVLRVRWRALSGILEIVKRASERLTCAMRISDRLVKWNRQDSLVIDQEILQASVAATSRVPSTIPIPFKWPRKPVCSRPFRVHFYSILWDLRIIDFIMRILEWSWRRDTLWIPSSISRPHQKFSWCLSVRTANWYRWNFGSSQETDLILMICLPLPNSFLETSWRLSKRTWHQVDEPRQLPRTWTRVMVQQLLPTVISQGNLWDFLTSTVEDSWQGDWILPFWAIKIMHCKRASTTVE